MEVPVLKTGKPRAELLLVRGGITLLVPYMFFAFQNVFDATFYGAGRTDYMLFESVVTNTVYYGAFFIAFLCGAWTPTLTGIAVMFGLGNIFDSIVSGIAYIHFRKTKHTSFTERRTAG